MRQSDHEQFVNPSGFQPDPPDHRCGNFREIPEEHLAGLFFTGELPTPPNGSGLLHVRTVGSLEHKRFWRCILAPGGWILPNVSRSPDQHNFRS